MATQNTIFVEIENYIRDLITKSDGFFNRDEILNASKEWMQKYPVEFNSILNLIENEGSRIDDDSTPSVAFHGAYADDSTPSVAFHGAYADDSTPSVAFGGRYADDSTPSVAFGGRYADDSTPSVAFCSRIDDDSVYSAAIQEEYGGNIMPDPMSTIVESPMGSDTIDSSPGGYPDDEFMSYMPLQRTMSSVPTRK